MDRRSMALFLIHMTEKRNEGVWWRKRFQSVACGSLFSYQKKPVPGKGASRIGKVLEYGERGGENYDTRNFKCNFR